MGLEKDASIAALLIALPMRENSWVAIDHWDALLHSIGIAREGDPRRLVYVSTFRLPPGKYYYECEEPDGVEDGDYRVAESGKDVDLEDLVRVMSRHLSRGTSARE